MSKPETIGGYKIHPAASLFPLMTGAEYERLVKSIRDNGLRVPVTVVGDQVLDGRNRIRACIDAGVKARTTHFEGGDPIEHVLALNLDRRHLNESQRAMVASRVATLRQGRPDESNTSVDVFTTQAEAAQKLNISVPSVQRARAVIERAVPEAAEAVERGDLAVSAAYELAKLKPENQREVLRATEGNMRQVIALAREATADPSATQIVSKRKPPVRKPDPRVTERDEKIIATWKDEGGRSPGLTAKILGIKSEMVQQALQRAGLNAAKRNTDSPLRGLVEGAKTAAFSWQQCAEEELWSNATPEQRADAAKALREARHSATQLIRMLEGVAAEAAE